jgi:hypothetical protein
VITIVSSHRSPSLECAPADGTVSISTAQLGYLLDCVE